MFRQLRSQKGLTLVELMVVVAIIAIIAAVAITVFQDIQKKAKLAADQANVAAMRSAVAIYYGKNNGIFPRRARCVTLVTPEPRRWQVQPRRGPTYDKDNGKVDVHARPSTTARKRLSARAGEDAQWLRSRSRWSCRSSMRSRAWASSTAS